MATGTFCGTGAWATAPKPGDPEGDVTLTATPAFGGIDVEWTLPGINPEAVAYVNIYRSTNLTAPDPVLHKVATGSFFYDKTTTATAIEYAYWIELVSINGTVGDRVGPAVATARPPIAAMLEGLTAQIDDGMLAQSLKGEIDKIELNKLEIDQALIDQAAVDDSLAVSFTNLQAYSDDTRAQVQQETVARANADDAFVSTVNTLEVRLDNDIDDVSAAVQLEETARVAADSALASQINTVQTTLNGDIASVQTNLDSEVAYINGDLDTIGAKFTVKTDVNGLVGGFGTYNDGTTVEAGFDVDRFWIGRTSSVDGTLEGGGTKPFIIEGNETFIKEAVIQTLTFDKLRTADGSLVVADGKVKADFILAKWANITGVSIKTADIQNGAIANAKIANAAINNAKIATAAVDTLELRGQAVTIPVSAYASGAKYSSSNSWTTMQSVSITPENAPVDVFVSMYGYFAPYINSSDEPRIGRVRLLVNGSAVYYYPDVFKTVSKTESKVVSFAYRIGATSATQSIAVQIQHVDHHSYTYGDYYFKYRFISAKAVKR